jgi:hypothetical protein
MKVGLILVRRYLERREIRVNARVRREKKEKRQDPSTKRNGRTPPNSVDPSLTPSSHTETPKSFNESTADRAILHHIHPTPEPKQQ